MKWFLRSERAVSFSRAHHSRTILIHLFGFALQYDAIPRNPVQGTSHLRRPKGERQALTVEQINAIPDAACRWRSGPDVKGPKPDGQVRAIIEVLLGTRCAWASASPSIRRIAVPDFAADVVRARLAIIPTTDPQRTIFADRAGRPLSPFNVRRTFRAFLDLADLAGEGITLRWYRRTGATVIARGASADAAATFRGHGSTAITERHYVEPDRSVDRGPAGILDRTLRRVNLDTALLSTDDGAGDDRALDFLEAEDIEAG